MAGFILEDRVYQTLVYNNEKNSQDKKIAKIRIINCLKDDIFVVYNLKTKHQSPLVFKAIYDSVNFGKIHVTNPSFFKPYISDGKKPRATKKVAKSNITNETTVEDLVKECNAIADKVGQGYGMTVAQLTVECLNLLSKGMGNRRVYISKDDEGNDYHGLVYSFETEIKRLKELDSWDRVPKDGSAVILG